MLIRITAPHFCAGLVFVGFHRQYEHRSAPILRYMKHWQWSDIRDYCRRKDWRLEVYLVEEEAQDEEEKHDTQAGDENRAADDGPRHEGAP